MTAEQLDYIISELNRLAEEALDKSRMIEWSNLDNDAKRLKEWKTTGMPGECPVNWSQYGIQLSETTTPSPEITSESTKQPILPILPEPDAEQIQQVQPLIEEAHAVESVAVEPEVMLAEEAIPSGQSLILETDANGNGKEAPILDTLEASSWRKELERAEGLLDADVAAAIKLLERVVDGGKAYADVCQQANVRLTDAKVKRTALIDELHQKARAARDQTNWQASEDFYQKILALDEKNERAKIDLASLVNAKLEKERQTFIQETKDNLRFKLNNVEALGKAVRTAEQLIARHEADDELENLYETAKSKWDDLRQKMGEVTTKMRTGSLANRAEAVHELEQLIFAGQLTTWDVTTDTYRPTSDILNDSKVLWQQASQQAVNTELTEVDKQLPHNLDWAIKRLKDAIAQQYYDRQDTKKKNPLGSVFYEQDLERLKEHQGKVEKQIADRDEAEDLVKQARVTPPEQGLNLLLEARSRWPYLEGIDKRIEEQRNLVANMLSSQVDSKLREAESKAAEEDFVTAQALASEADKLTKQLPGEALPILKTAAQKVALLLQVIKEREGLVNSFAMQESEIRRLLRDPHTQQTAVDLFDQISQQPEFIKYHRLAALRLEVSAYRDAGAQLAEVQKLVGHEERDWQEIARLCDALISTRTGGDIARQAEIIRDEARLELRIRKAKQDLKNGDVAKAEFEFLGILQKHPERQSELKSALDEIAACKANDPAANPKMALAAQLKYAREPKDQLRALELYREVAEDLAKSSYTAEAQRQAQEMSDALRLAWLPKIRDAEANWRKQKLSDEILEEAGGLAETLRKGKLVWEEEEKRTVRTIQVAYQRHHAEKQANIGRLDEAVRIWESLEHDWPGVIDIQTEARKARKQKAIWEAQNELSQNPDQEAAAHKALHILREEQTNDHWGADGEINLKLADAYRTLEQFSEAKRCAENARIDPVTIENGSRLLQLIEDDRQIAEVRKEYNTYHTRKDYETAFEVLNKLPDELLHREDVEMMRSTILGEATNELMEIANREQGKSNTEGMVVAVEALVRLQNIETLAQVKNGKGAAALEDVKEELPRIAMQVLREAGKYNPSRLALDSALAEARRIANQLRAFQRITKGFPDEDRENLETNIRNRLALIMDQIQRLEHIQTSLNKVAQNSPLWQEAVRTNNFSTVQTEAAVVEQNAGNDLDVMEIKEFRKRLQETVELRGHIAYQVQQLVEGERNLFLAQENYAEVLRVCAGLHNLPNRKDLTVPHQSDSWEVVTNEEYHYILSLADSSFNFFDSVLRKNLKEIAAGKDLLGILEELAQKRLDDLVKWQSYVKEAQRLHEGAKASHESARDALGKMGLVEVTKLWQNAYALADAAETHLQSDPAEISSLTAQDLFDEKQDWLQNVREYKARADTSLASYSECQKNPPKTEDLARLIQYPSYDTVADNLIRARSVGGDAQYMLTVEHLEWKVLPAIKKLPAPERIQALFERAEKCLGVDHSLTRKLGADFARLQNSSMPQSDEKKGLLGKIFGNKNK